MYLLRTRAPSGATAFHIAASRGQARILKKLLWSLYHKCGGDEKSSTAFGVVRTVLNSPGLKRGQGVVDAALATNIELAMYLKHNWTVESCWSRLQEAALAMAMALAMAITTRRP